MKKWILLLSLSIFCIPALCLEVTYFGAAGEVSGSMALLKTDDFSILIDVGSHYGEHSDGGKQIKTLVEPTNEEEFLFEPNAIDAVILTHAHRDHAGRLPELYRLGFRGKVYSTTATKEILKVMLEMQVKYDSLRDRKWEWSRGYKKKGDDFFKAHWHPNCRWRNQILDHNKVTFSGPLHDLKVRFDGSGIDVRPCKICIREELEPLWRLFSVSNYNAPIDINPNIRVSFLDAKHIPGSASIFLQIREPQRTKPFEILFSGDLGSDMSHFLDEPLAAPKVDYLFVEGTYGDCSRSFEIKDEYNKFLGSIGSTLNGGGVVWIPSFALDRSQRILYEIQVGIERGIIPRDVRVYLPSPTANRITDLYLANSHWSNSRTMNRLHSIYSRTDKRYIDPEKFDPPPKSIIITTSGMMDLGLSVGLIPKLLKRRNLLLAFVGYQSPHTYGGQLESGAFKVEIDGKTIEGKAQVKSFRVFSGHGDADDIDRWLSKNNEAQIYLVHGEAESLEKRKADLISKGFNNVLLVERFREYELN